MPWMCPQCGSPNGDTVPTCAVCGAVAPQASPSGGQQGGYGGGQAYGGQAYGGQAYGGAAAGGFGGPPGQPPGGQWGQPPQPGQWGQAPAGAPMGSPHFAGPAAPKDDGSKMVWGCGIAGCLGVIVLIAIIGGALFLMRGSVSASGDDDDSDDRRAPSGRLADNIPKRVGSYEVSSARKLQVANAVDAMVVVYRSGSTEIEHAIAIFPDEDAAQQNLVDSTSRVDKDTNVEPTIVRIKDPDGKVIGLGSHFESNPEWLCYRIGKMMAILKGPRGKVVPFFKKLP